MRCPNPDCPDITVFGVQGRYREGITHCAKCGTALIADPDDTSEALATGVQGSRGADAPMLTDVDQDDALVAVISFDYRYQADLMTSCLIANGVPAEVICDDCGAQNPALSLTNEAFVRVRSSDLEEADDLLDAVLDESAGFPEALEPDPSDDIDPAALARLQHTFRWSQLCVIAGTFAGSYLLFPAAYSLLPAAFLLFQTACPFLPAAFLLFPAAFFFALYGFTLVRQETSPVAVIYFRRFVLVMLLSCLHTAIVAATLILVYLSYWLPK